MTAYQELAAEEAVAGTAGRKRWSIVSFSSIGRGVGQPDWRRNRDSKHRSLSQSTLVFFAEGAPKKVDRSGLEPSHHLSGTEGSSPASSSEESANHQFLSGGAYHCGRSNAAAS